MSIKNLTERNDRRIDSIISSFESRMSTIVERSSSRVRQLLYEQLNFSDDLVDFSPMNARTISALPTIFRQAMNAEGYSNLVDRFLSEFGGQVKSFESILEQISRGFKVKAKFTARDLQTFEVVKSATGSSLEELVAHAGQTAKTQALLGMGGLSFDRLTDTLATRLSTTKSDASTLAATGISTFYRTVSSKGYEKIEKELEDTDSELRYTYYGPPSSDRFIRPFCKKLMAKAAAGTTWSRAQIDRMDNQQLPDVFTTCGGYNCRHQWIVALPGGND